MADKTIAELEQALTEATARYAMERAASERARGQELAAASDLRDAQKAFDAGVARLRASATAGDWAERPVRAAGRAET